MITARARIGLLALITLFSVPALAQDGLYQYQEYATAVANAQKRAPLGDNPFGERVSLFNGSTEFVVTDIDLPGNNNLPVRLSRRFVLEDRNQGLGNEEVQSLGGFFDWDVEVPYIEGTFTAAYGWVARTSSGASSNNRCSLPGAPYVGTNTAPVENIWHGYTLHLPDEAGGGKMLSAIPGAFGTPTAGTGIWPWVTNGNVRIACIPPTIANSYPGEGFYAITPNGTRYTFNYMLDRPAPMLKYWSGTTRYVARKRIYMLATRVEDRFGNWVAYSYTPTTVGITSSDGRAITITYTNGRITSATANGRTWQYAYSENSSARDGGLSSVTLPDNSTWQYFKYGVLRSPVMPVPHEGDSPCDFNPGESVGPFQYFISHPSGALGLFTFVQQTMVRAPEPGGCAFPQPSFYDVWALNSRGIVGTGIANPLLTTYAIAGAAGVDTPDSKWNTVTNPDGSKARYRYGTTYLTNEGRLLEAQILSPSGAVLSDRVLDYVTDSTVGPFASLIGTTPHIWQHDEELVRPLRTQTITQDGVTFTMQVNSFDTLARPLSITRSSSLGMTRTDVTAYQDEYTKWVLGQIASITNSNTGLVSLQRLFDTSTLPQHIYLFGKRLQTLAYNADGTVQSVTDGNNHVTTLQNWKRGIPQSILYADNTSQSAVANDNGWILSVTDQNGFVTGYDYDSMGRLTTITWPSGDDVAWNTTTEVFERVESQEYEIAAGHWRSTESTGNHRKISYFDGLWRPILTTEYDVADDAGTRRFQRFEYDYANRVTFSSYPSTSSSPTTGVTTQYDALGRILSVSQDSELGALVTKTEYLPGYQIRVTNPRGYETLSGYQVFDTPSDAAPVWIQHPEGAYTTIVRDVLDKVTSITRHNADNTLTVTRQYVYDSTQQLCKTIEPETGSTVMSYDGANNLAWSASGLALLSTSSCDLDAAYGSGRRADRTYDARNRLWTLTFPDTNGNQIWQYKPDGLPWQITTTNSDGASQTVNTYDYDKRRLLVSETLQQPSWYSWGLGYGHDANGNLSSISYPSGRTVSYAPNALGQPTQAGSYATGVTYYPNGAIHQFTYGNNIVHTMTQNARQLAEHVTDGSGVVDNTYIYDRNGNVGQILDGVAGNAARTMTYDGLDRLVQTDSAAFAGDHSFHYGYDVLDNVRTSKLAGVKDHTYSYDGNNRLTGVLNNSGATLFSLGYDVQGNLRTKASQLFTFDFGNRLRKVEQSGTYIESYRYDANGRRVNAWSPANGNILSFYGRDGVLRYQQDERVAKAFDYISLGGSLIARVSNPTAPGAPMLTAPSFSSSGSYTVSWTARAGATRYELQEAVGSGAWQTVYNDVGTSRAFTGKASGSYNYRVMACGTVGCSAWSQTATVSVQTVPSTAPSLSAPDTALNGNYTVSWTSVSDAIYYSLEESANGGAFAEVYNGTGQSRVYSSKPTGSYVYRVKACNPAGCSSASPTRTVQVVYTPSSAPSISAPSSNYTGSFTVSWSAVSGATAYRLEESSDGGNIWTELQNAASTSAAISGRSARTYLYRVRACNVAGCSGYSSNASVVVLFPPSDAPSVSTPAQNSSGSYTVSWTTVATATSYALEEFNGAWTQLQNSASTSIALSGRGAGTYGYRVRGCNAAGCGPYSVTQYTTVTFGPPTPLNLNVVVKPQGPANEPVNWLYTATWSASAGATRYEVSGLVTYSGPNTTYSFTWDTFETDVTYSVRACNANGCSAWSPPVYGHSQ